MSTAIATTGTGTGTGGDVNITKPVSLASGDMMIAFVTSQTGGASGDAPHSTPASWTVLGSVGNATNNTVLTVAAKIADSGDAAASNFSFTSTGDNGNTIGVIARVTGTNGFTSVALNVRSRVVLSNDFPTPSVTGLTTIAVNSLLLMGAGSEITDGDINFSGYAVANSDPTWTEQQDLYFEPSGTAINFGLASSTYATAQDTGNASVTADADGGSIAIGLVAITENVPATVTVTHLSVAPGLNAPNASAGANVTVDHLSVSPTLNAPNVKGTTETQWTNEAKPSTTWTNTPKI